MDIYDYINQILTVPAREIPCTSLGHSREGRLISGFRYGHGKKNVSLIAGNHADEPIGPLLLRKLVVFLADLAPDHHLLRDFSWWIVPHGNPDGEKRNRQWYKDDHALANLPAYLLHAERELPGDDVEFGFPIEGSIRPLRPENEAIYEFWKTAGAPFDLHVSLHGMRSSYGAWFLIDAAWKARTAVLQKQCCERTHLLGHPLYDLDRFGEKGFERIAEGFCTRPDSQAMKRHFLALGDEVMASKFHASSMESIRSLGGDCLTLVSEMPLFLFPKVKRELTWPDPYLQQWNAKINDWKLKLHHSKMSSEQCLAEAARSGVVAMPWDDQLRLQWQLICSGLQTITA